MVIVYSCRHPLTRHTVNGLQAIVCERDALVLTHSTLVCRLEGVQSADPKRGPGRPSMRSTPGQPGTAGRPGRKPKTGLGNTTYSTNELVGRKIW